MQVADYLKLVSAVERLLGEAKFLFKEDPAWSGRTGAYFCLADGKDGVPIFLPAEIGTVPLEKREKYLSFSKEKPRRLASHPDHLTSSQSRNPDANQWGGAVRCGEVILSISGLPEMGDEAFMFIIAELYVGMGFGQPSAAVDMTRQLAVRDNNPYWQRLRSFIGRLLA